MGKKAEFHDAQIVVRIRVMNGDGSTERVTQAQPSIACANCEAEWASVQRRIDEAIEALQEQLDGDGNPDS
jgi:hypothetical protein